MIRSVKDPDLLVVVELGMLLERFDRGRAGLSMFRRVELEPVTAAQELIPPGPEVRPGLASVKSTSKRTARRIKS